MNKYPLNTTTVTITTDVKMNEALKTKEIFTQDIRDMILERLDELIAARRSGPPIACVNLNISDEHSTIGNSEESIGSH